MSGFLFYNSFYSYYISIRISGTIGRLQGKTRIIRGKTYYGMTSRLFPKITYCVRKGKQYSYPYTIPTYRNTPRQQQERDAVRQGVLSWKALTPAEKNTYKDTKHKTYTISGYNFFMSNYIKNFLK